MKLVENADLTALNTLKLPSKARYFARFHDLGELHDLLAYAKEQQLPVKVLGGGSNVLLDEFIDALVIQSALTHVEALLPEEDFNRVLVQSGVNWHDWVQKSIHYGHGLENLALIPGTVGAAPVQNIGAYGVEVAEFIEVVEGVQISTGNTLKLTPDHCQFGYRDSIFKHLLANDFVITQVVFKLLPEFNPVLEYGPLQVLRSDSLTAQRLIEKVCEIRQSKLPNPLSIPNAGSFFKNPILSLERANLLIQQHPQIPNYALANQQVKLSAAWLIEQAGFKGLWQGNVRMHDKQALVLTSNGQATFDEVMQLKERIVATVEEKFGVHLEAEPQAF